MKAWLAKLVADLNGVPDEIRLAFLATEAVYLVLWLIWFAVGNWSKWPTSIAAFCGGAAGIATAFGASIKVRGSH